MLILAKRLAGFLLFDLVWLSAVAGRESWVIATVVLVAAQIALATRSARWSWLQFAVLTFIGLGLELLVGLLGLIQFTGGLLPPWLILLWLGYVAMAITALDWLAEKMWLAILLGLVFGPVTYIAGTKIGAAEAPYGALPMGIAYAIGWALYMAVFVLRMRNKKAPEVI